jgi:small-conductance mechanosensitive channel
VQCVDRHGPTGLEIRKSRDEVIGAVKSALDKAHIEIPYPYRTLTFADSLKVDSQAIQLGLPNETGKD